MTATRGNNLPSALRKSDRARLQGRTLFICHWLGNIAADECAFPGLAQQIAFGFHLGISRLSGDTRNLQFNSQLTRRGQALPWGQCTLHDVLPQSGAELVAQALASLGRVFKKNKRSYRSRVRCHDWSYGYAVIGSNHKAKMTDDNAVFCR